MPYEVITAVTILGEKETPAIGGEAIKTLQKQILAKGEKIDVVGGATVTSKAVLEALKAALDAARGIAAPSGKIVDGKYVVITSYSIHYTKLYEHPRR